MKNSILFIIALTFSHFICAQSSSSYSISFENAVHHEAEIDAVFTNLLNDEVSFTMSRSSPGRYALHEFVKNIYNVKVTDGKGNLLETSRPDPYSWKVSGHDGTIKVHYTLFANHGDGTYAQIDETHAHLNMPATFIYIPELANNEFRVTFNVREDLNWKIATQLRHVGGNTYHAKNMQYFLDSPTEISNYSKRSFVVDGQTINFILHHNGTEVEFDQHIEKIKPLVQQQKAVFGELPKFEYQNYYFLACYMPHVDGDAMEHRNSTVITNVRSLADGGIQQNLGSVSHEFFHVWNVERIRPKSIEPFDFSNADMSGELWFGEGFTNYYDGLTMCRAGLMDHKSYIEGMTEAFNSVWNSPGRQYFNPIEMSYQAPFVDAATSVDPNNRGNTFISYYSYGDMLGLALDLSLREKGLNLDDYMKMVWYSYGKDEKPYTVNDLYTTLVGYSGKELADHFFNNFIYKSGMPDMKRLFEQVGVVLSQDTSKASFGAEIENSSIKSLPFYKGSAYNAGLDIGDKILQIGNFTLNAVVGPDKILSSLKPDDSVSVVFERFGKRMETTLVLQSDPSYTIRLFEDHGLELSDDQKTAREDWLKAKD